MPLVIEHTAFSYAGQEKRPIFDGDSCGNAESYVSKIILVGLLPQCNLTYSNFKCSIGI